MCPVCRAQRREPRPLELGTVLREAAGDVVEAVLVCPDPQCRCEYPVLDGVPIVVPDPREFVARNLAELRARDDLSAFTESLLGDCAGPGSDYDRARYQLSTYARGHYGDLDVAARFDSGLLGLVGAGLELAGGAPAGPWLDVGCAVGRTSFELARRTGDLVLGVDLNPTMLRLAQRVARTGRVTHPLRRVGLVYDRRDYEVDLPAREAVDFWACDALALPFAAGAFAGAFSLNVLDCAAWPLSHLQELGRVLAPGAPALIATPYDWSTGATPVEGWLGGHSQRAEAQGSSVRELHRVLSPDRAAGVDTGLVMTGERDDVPWTVYVHERAAMQYRVHLVAARRG